MTDIAGKFRFGGHLATSVNAIFMAHRLGQVPFGRCHTRRWGVMCRGNADLRCDADLSFLIGLNFQVADPLGSGKAAVSPAKDITRESDGLPASAAGNDGKLTASFCNRHLRFHAVRCPVPANASANVCGPARRLNRHDLFATNICDIGTADFIELPCRCKTYRIETLRDCLKAHCPDRPSS